MANLTTLTTSLTWRQTSTRCNRMTFLSDMVKTNGSHTRQTVVCVEPPQSIISAAPPTIHRRHYSTRIAVKVCTAFRQKRSVRMCHVHMHTVIGQAILNDSMVHARIQMATHRSRHKEVIRQAPTAAHAHTIRRRYLLAVSLTRYDHSQSLSCIVNHTVTCIDRRPTISGLRGNRIRHKTGKTM